MFKIDNDGTNKDLMKSFELAGMAVEKVMNRHQGREYYLEKWGSFESKFKPPVVEKYNDKLILRADLAPGGLKAFGGERVIAESPYNTMVYVAPRQGHAPDAIAAIAKAYDKKCVFFMPASKRVSDHQAAIFAYDNVKVKFFKTAAMPMLNSYAKKWAEQHQAQYLPFGLTGNEMVTAGLVNMCKNVSNQLGYDPSEIHCAVSTGTMIRALQIGWPNAEPVGTVVSRNIHKGEVGEAILHLANMPFLKKTPDADTMPVPSTGAYDAKAWRTFDETGAPNSIFINVGSDKQINEGMKKVNIDSINSQREWNDLTDWDKENSLNEGYSSHWV